MQGKNEQKQSFDTLTPEQMRVFCEKYKQGLTPEDLRWYEDNPELIPFTEVIAELEEFVHREGLQGIEE
ncbi:MAG: hypothetical protein L0Y72_08815 [Gemmataceae bacterium]|nr:hypothetical protein [Gemmataceae bacterium]